jgi:hypothetical protein
MHDGSEILMLVWNRAELWDPNQTGAAAASNVIAIRLFFCENRHGDGPSPSAIICNDKRLAQKLFRLACD